MTLYAPFASTAHQILKKNGLLVTYASDTYIKGTVSVGEDGVLYSSIPMENGWAVYIDGKKQKSFDLDAGLLCCDVIAGEHLVEYRYHTPGLSFGLLLSVLSLSILIAYM